LSTKKIVLIDDDQGFGSSVKSHLSKFGYEVEQVYRPCAVANALRTFRPDIVLTDQPQPGTDGKNLPFTLKQLNTDEFSFKLVLFPASCDAACSDLVKSGLADGCLEKGMPLDELKKAIDSFCNS
jgi:DNA-binding response OmpR family regulator